MQEMLDKGRRAQYLPPDFRFDVMMPTDETRIGGEKLSK